MKILFLSHKFSPDIGGIEVSSEILANGFAEAGHDVHVMTWSSGTNGKVFPFQIIRNPGARELIAQHKWADIVFENNPCLRMIWPLMFTWRPSVVALQTWITRLNGKVGLQDKLKMLHLKKAKKVVAISEAVRERCFPDAVIIGNPYQEKTFKKVEEIQKDKDFVFLGRLVSDKGADMAVNAICQLIKNKTEASSNYKNLSLTIIGDGPERNKLEAAVKENGIEQHVQFTGNLQGEKLVASLNRHKFMLVPSVWEEPFGIVALEGMACGCIPIVSDGGGLPDAVGKGGLVFKRGDTADLVSKIKEVLSNVELEENLRNAAKEHLANHRATAISKKYLDILGEVYNNKKSL